jgi:hypothetical protein
MPRAGGFGWEKLPALRAREIAEMDLRRPTHEGHEDHEARTKMVFPLFVFVFFVFFVRFVLSL